MLTQVDLKLASMPKCQPMKYCEYGPRSQTGLVGRPKTFEFKVCLFEEEEKRSFKKDDNALAPLLFARIT